MKPDDKLTEAVRTMIRDILVQYRNKEQDGYLDYRDGKWSHDIAILRSLISSDEMNTLFAFAGIVPDPVVPLGSCGTCRFAVDVKGNNRGWGRPCSSCSMPKHSNWEPRPKGWKPEPRDR